jgi:predicted nucleic acid-binding protein
VQSFFDQYAFLVRCDDDDRGAVDFLLSERSRAGMRDRGEVEAIVQATQLGAMVIVDDPWGRKLAEHSELSYHGTVWVLQRFYELGLMSSSGLRTSFALLRDRGTRLPWDTIDALLLEIGEQPLRSQTGS